MGTFRDLERIQLVRDALNQQFSELADFTTHLKSVSAICSGASGPLTPGADGGGFSRTG